MPPPHSSQSFLGMYQDMFINQLQEHVLVDGVIALGHVESSHQHWRVQQHKEESRVDIDDVRWGEPKEEAI